MKIKWTWLSRIKSDKKVMSWIKFWDHLTTILGAIVSTALATVAICLTIKQERTDQKVMLLEALLIKNDTLIEQLTTLTSTQQEQLEVLTDQYFLIESQNQLDEKEKLGAFIKDLKELKFRKRNFFNLFENPETRLSIYEIEVSTNYFDSALKGVINNSIIRRNEKIASRLNSFYEEFESFKKLIFNDRESDSFINSFKNLRFKIDLIIQKLNSLEHNLSNE